MFILFYKAYSKIFPEQQLSIIYMPKICCHILFCFGNTLSCAQGLLLVPYSGLLSGGSGDHIGCWRLQMSQTCGRQNFYPLTIFSDFNMLLLISNKNRKTKYYSMVWYTHNCKKSRSKWQTQKSNIRFPF